METIQIGTVLKPQGIMGQIKVADYTDGASSVNKITKVQIGEVWYKVLAMSFTGGAFFLSLSGIADRNAAELLRGKDVFCLREEVKKAEGMYFIVDLIGCDLYLSSGKRLGKVVDITKSNVDIIEADTIEGRCYFPFLKKLNADVNLAEKKITVDAKIFTEVVLYQ